MESIREEKHTIKKIIDNCNRALDYEDKTPGLLLANVPGMKVKPPGNCISPVEVPAVFRTVPFALMLLLAETGAR